MTLTSSGAYTFDPNGQYESLGESETATETFVYTLTDGNGGTAEATVTIVIDGVNDAPDMDLQPPFDVGSDDVLTDDVLSNASDAEGDVITITSLNGDGNAIGEEITLPSGANVTLESDGTFSYEPAGEFESLSHGESASDTFEYTVSDGRGHTESATVTIIVHGENDLPKAADDSEATTEDEKVSYDSILVNDSDPEGDNLTVKSVEGCTGNVGSEITLPSGVKVTLTSSGAYTFDPNGHYESLGESETATETFVYTVTDGNGGTAEATVTIVIDGVNDPPVAENDDLGSSPAASAVSESLFLNDSDAEKDDLTVTEVGGQSIGSSGTTTVSLPSGAIMTIDGATGEVTVDPNGQFEYLDANETALVTFEYVISDGNGGTDSATVTLTLEGANNAPYAEDDSKTTLPTSTVGATMVENDVDPEDDPLTVTLVGDVALNETVGSAVVTLPSGAVVTVSASGQYTYDPSGHFDSLDVNEEGVDTFTYTISDGKGGTDEATVTILMPGVNDPPMPDDDVHSLQVGEALAFSDTAFANDSDPDGDELTVVAINDSTGDVGTEITLPSGANVTLESDGTYSYEPAGEFESLSHGESASDTFEYTVSDGRGHTESATVTIIVHGENDLPKAADDSEATTEDEKVSYDSILVNDSDPEGDNLTVKSVEGCTGNVGSEITLPSGVKVTLTSSGAYTFDPNGQYESLGESETATETFVYTVTDGNGGTAEATVTIVIDGVNDPPMPEDDLYSFVGGTKKDVVYSDDVLVNDSDPEGDSLTITALNQDDSSVGTEIILPSGANVALDSDGSFLYDPGHEFESLHEGETASDTFEYTVSDGNGQTEVATVTIVIDGNNDLPMAADDTETTTEDMGVSSSVILNDSDPEDDLIQLFVKTMNGSEQNVGHEITLPSGAKVTLSSSGTYTYDPNGQYESLGDTDTATETFVYTITDMYGGTDEATVTIVITGSNDGPIPEDDVHSVIGGNDLTDEVLLNDTDPENDVLTVVAINDSTGDVGTEITLPSGANVTLESDGTYSYEPAGEFESSSHGESASDTFEYTMSDGR